jgi:hypothetical protein
MYHEGAFVLASGRSADLDASPSDVQWGTLRRDRAGVDLVFVGTWLNTYSDGGGVVRLSRTETRPCAQMTGYGDEAIPDTDLLDGARLCVLTNDNRFSLVTVIHLSPDRSSIQLRVATFKRDDEP